MAEAFRMAVIAGRTYEAKLAQQYKHAVASRLTAFLSINSI
jgi:thiazole synthase ThiGH ThiG subunit